MVAEFRAVYNARFDMHAGVAGTIVARTWMVAAIAVADVPPGQIVDPVTCAADPLYGTCAASTAASPLNSSIARWPVEATACDA